MPAGSHVDQNHICSPVCGTQKGCLIIAYGRKYGDSAGANTEVRYFRQLWKHLNINSGLFYGSIHKTTVFCVKQTKTGSIGRIQQGSRISGELHGKVILDGTEGDSGGWNQTCTYVEIVCYHTVACRQRMICDFGQMLSPGVAFVEGKIPAAILPGIERRKHLPLFGTTQNPVHLPG